jgi:hypothetical protein
MEGLAHMEETKNANKIRTGNMKRQVYLDKVGVDMIGKCKVVPLTGRGGP